MEPPFHKVLGRIMKGVFATVEVNYMEKNPDVSKPHYCDHILPGPWPFIILRFHCILTMSMQPYEVNFVTLFSLSQGDIKYR